MNPRRDPRIPTDCPTYICGVCPICGIFVGASFTIHPPAQGVKNKEKEKEEAIDYEL